MMNGAAADGAGIANIDKGTRASSEHVCKVFGGHFWVRQYGVSPSLTLIDALNFAPMRMAASWYRSYRIAEYKVAARLLDLRAPASSPLVVRKTERSGPVKNSP
jgi:hypothetical protein